MHALTPDEIARLQEAKTPNEVQRLLTTRLNDLLRRDPELFAPLEINPIQHRRIPMAMVMAMAMATAMARLISLRTKKTGRMGSCSTMRNGTRTSSLTMSNTATSRRRWSVATS